MLKYTSQLKFYLYADIFVALTEKSIKQEENWKIEGKIVILYPQKYQKKEKIIESTNTSPFASLELTPSQFMEVLGFVEVFYGTLIVQKGTIFCQFLTSFCLLLAL